MFLIFRYYQRAEVCLPMHCSLRVLVAGKEEQRRIVSGAVNRNYLIVHLIDKTCRYMNKRGRQQFVYAVFMFHILRA